MCQKWTELLFIYLGEGSIDSLAVGRSARAHQAQKVEISYNSSKGLMALHKICLIELGFHKRHSLSGQDRQ